MIGVTFYYNIFGLICLGVFIYGLYSIVCKVDAIMVKCFEMATNIEDIADQVEKFDPLYDEEVAQLDY